MIRSIQNSFVSGEIAPSLHGRHDLKAYFSGAQRVENLIVRKAGGLRKRQGTDILLDITAYAGGRVVPFFYDRLKATYILISGQTARFIRRATDNTLEFVQSEGQDYTVVVPWPDDVLPNIRHYQLGDTIYINAPGFQAAKLVRTADDNWSLSYLTGLSSTPAPPTLKATASNFETSGTVDTTQDYALYAVKDGVISTPSKRTVPVTLPWAAGAKVALSWTPDLTTGVDGYLLGKKNGAYYGILLEAYPTRTALSLTSKTWATSGVSAAAPATTHLFSSNHATALRAADPQATAASELKLYHSKFAFQIPRAAGADPQATLSITTSTAISSIRFFLGGFFANSVKQDIVTVDYSGGIRVRIERYSSMAWSTIAETDLIPSAAGTGYAEFTTASTTAGSKYRVTFLNLDATETGVVLRGIAVYNRLATPGLVTGTWTLGTTARSDFNARGVSGHCSLASSTSTTAIDVSSAADETDRDTRQDISCSPKRYISAHATPMAIAVAEDSGSRYATARLSASSVFRVQEFRLYLGAEAPEITLRTPGSKKAHTSNTVSAVIQYTNDGIEWLTVQASGTDVVFSIPDQYAANPVSILVPDDEDTVTATANAIGWGLRFKSAADAPVVIRGCTCMETTIQSSFIDANHSPDTLIDSQTYIAPGGSTDMTVSCIALYQQRIIMAGAPSMPFTLWASKVGELNMWYATRPITDADPFSFTIPAIRAAAILHMVSDRRLLLFTEGGVYSVEGSDSEGFSYRTVRVNRVANVGACAVPPVPCVNTVLFVAEDARTLYELRYDITQDGLIPVDRSVLAAHITEASPVRNMAWQAAPDSVLWVILADGTLAAFTYMPEHEVAAWSRHTIPYASVTDIVSPGAVTELPDRETASKLIYVATVGGKTLLLGARPPVASDNPAISAAACLDLAQQATLQTASATVTPPHPYPDGAAVTAVNTSDGTTAELTSDGTDLTSAAALAAGTWLLGIPVSARLDTLRPELPGQNIQAFKKNVDSAVVRVNRSRSVSIAPLDASATPYAYPAHLTDSPAAIADGRVPLVSQDIVITPQGQWNRDGRLSVTDASPWPLEILSVTKLIETGSL